MISKINKKYAGKVRKITFEKNLKWNDVPHTTTRKVFCEWNKKAQLEFMLYVMVFAKMYMRKPHFITHSLIII